MGTAIRVKSQSHRYPSNRAIKELRKAGRAALVLGERLKIDSSTRSMKSLGKEYYYPSKDVRNVENLYAYGPSGTGKTWGVHSLMGQSFFKERRSWVIIDTKGSVSYDTLVYIRVNGVEQIQPIGKIIDLYIGDSEEHASVYPPDDLHVLSLGKDHKLKWKEVIQVSKHKPSPRILRITTKSGREIVATKNHSFVTLQNGVYTPLKGADLKPGDHIPVARHIPIGSEEELDVLSLFEEDRVIDFDHIQTALDLPEIEVSPIAAYDKSGLSCITYGAFCRYKWGERGIYPQRFKVKTRNNSNSNPFPKKIELSEDFGFVCGIFVAEGRAVNKGHYRRIDISNTNETVQERLLSWLDKVNLSHNFDGKKNVRIYSLVLAELFTKWFGNGTVTDSGTKFLPPFIFNSNRGFIRGFIDGYMSGDGFIREMPRKEISFITKSSRLRDDLNVIFTKMGMPLRYSKCGIYYSGYLHSSDYETFKKVGFTHPKKKKRLEQYNRTAGYDSKHIIDLTPILTGLNRRKEGKTARSAIAKIYKGEDFISLQNAKELYKELKDRHPDRAKKLRDLLEGGVWWDKIAEIEDIEATSKYVYDFAVERDENFMLANGAIVHNSYLGNHLPNTDYEKELARFGLRPQGIPRELMVVCAPTYYINGLSQQKVKADQITHAYRIPISMANIPILFEITKLQSNTQYAASYNMEWKTMLARTRFKPKKRDLYEMLTRIETSAATVTASRWTQNLISRIKAAESLILCEEAFSPIGAALLQAARDHFPRWIVMTFKHAESSGDSINLAIYAAVLEEVRKITELAKDNKLDLRVGLCVDELQWYADKDKKDSEAYKATKEAIYRWGRSNRLWRIWGTQSNSHLDPLLQDDIRKFSREGAYQKVLNFFTIKDPGYCSYMDRQKENRFDLNLPYLVPYIKTPPPMFQIIE